jgi:16S rRNA (uracil1498-N3)-methyltransferase
MSRTPRLYAPGMPAAGRMRLSDEEAGHLVRVLRAQPGDEVRLFDGAGREALGVVVETDKRGAVVELRRELDAPRPARDVVLVTAVPRGERMEWLVEKTVEAGVAAIVPLAAHRSVRKEAGPNAIRRWNRAAVEAAKQCGRAVVPDVAEPTTLADAIARTATAGMRFVATPGASGRIRDFHRTDDVAFAVFIGPEGGFEPDESTELARAGTVPFSLGPTILRVETAALVAVHQAAN